jgi:hypothetical protein
VTLINKDLIVNPLNWLTVFAMLAIASVLVTLLNKASEA